jgi:hypothetical protein
MNRKDRRAAKIKVEKPTLRQLATALSLAAPWCIRTRWPIDYAPCVEMSFAGREVLRRYQYGANMASCVLVVGNPKTTLCVGDNRAGYDLLTRRGRAAHLPPREQARFGEDARGLHVVLKAHDGQARAFLDLTFGQIGIRTKGAIQVPPVFAAFGDIDWPSAEIEGVWFAYAGTPEPPEMEKISAHEWSGLIDDFATLAQISIDCRNNEQAFEAEMQRQMRQLRR